MSNNANSSNHNDSNQEQSNSNSTQSYDNDAVTGVEVVKDDTVVYEDGDFEAYNEEHDFEEETDSSSAKDDLATDDKSDDSSNKDSKDESDKEDKSKKKDSSDKKDKSKKQDESSKKDSADKEDKPSSAIAGIYQWASKLKDDLTSDTGGMTQDISEKATAMMLGKLVDAVDLELAAFDKSLEMAKNLIATAEERRETIVARKEKYQGMIEKLDQE